MARAEPERKSDAVRRLLRNGEFKAALRIAKDFQLGITYGQRDKMRLGYECMVNGRFYVQLGVDLEKAISDGIQVAIDLYGDRKPQTDGQQ